MSSDRKMYTAELQRRKSLPPRIGAVAEQPSVPDGEVLRLLAAIQSDIKDLAQSLKGEEQPEPEPEPEEDPSIHQTHAEVSMLKTELRALAHCIEQTKAEIAALRPANSDDDHLMVVAFELDAIVSSTEQATQQILSAAEKIEGLSREIQSQASEGYINRITEDINDTIISIFEACNFQDITGQRITKVVRTLKYVEARIGAMIDIWGAEDIAEVMPVAPQQSATDERALLNGPQLGDNGISQEDIDKLFG